MRQRFQRQADEIAAAFPASLARDAKAVVAVAPQANHRSAGTFTAVVEGCEVVIPYRIYPPEPDPAIESALSPRQRMMLACLFTRHHDGWVRDRRVREILTSNAAWVVPFVVHLVGEYVIEIVRAIQQGLDGLDDPDDPRHNAYRRFVEQNPTFIDLMAARATSYWSLYYRDRFPDWSASPNRYDYPGLAVLRLLRSLS